MAGKLALVDYRSCDPRTCGDGVCAAALVCPQRVLRQEAAFEAPIPDPGPCRACGECVHACPVGAVQLMPC